MDAHNDWRYVGKRFLSVPEMLKYTSLGRSKGIAWCKEIGALRKIGRRSLYDRAVIDKALSGENDG